MKSHVHTSTYHNGFPITIDKPMVLIPTSEYLELLREANHLPTPALNKSIAKARARFRKGSFIKWEKLKQAA